MNFFYSICIVVVAVFVLSLQKSPLPENCGTVYYPDKDPAVIGGYDARKGSVPYLARLWNRDRNEYGCGGTIITSKHVLTAAHCLISDAMIYDVSRVTFGAQKNYERVEGQVDFDVDEATIHPNYMENDFKRDIAILKIKPDRNGNFIQFNKWIQPACLDEGQHLGADCKVSGFGAIQYEPQLDPTTLQSVMVKVRPSEVCINHVYNQTRVMIDDDIVCAGVLGKGKDGCYGDSGGPIAWKNDEGKLYVIGVVSCGDSKCRGLGTYTNVTAVRDWILSVIEE